MSSPKETAAIQLERVLADFPSVTALRDRYTDEAKRRREELLFSSKGPYEMHRLTFRSTLGHAYNVSKVRLDSDSKAQFEPVPSVSMSPPALPEIKAERHRSTLPALAAESR